MGGPGAGLGLICAHRAARSEARFPELADAGGTANPSLERVRFRANPSLGYPPRESAALNWTAGDDRLDVVINFLGLFGPSSPCPFYTEEVIRDLDAGGGFAVPGFFITA